MGRRFLRSDSGGVSEPGVGPFLAGGRSGMAARSRGWSGPSGEASAARSREWSGPLGEASAAEMWEWPGPPWAGVTERLLLVMGQPTASQVSMLPRPLPS